MLGILLVEHERAGLSLDFDDHNVHLMRNGHRLATWNATRVRVAEIREAADQVLNWDKSGVTLEVA